MDVAGAAKMATKTEAAIWDETGARWKVSAGDPASKFVNALRAQTFGFIVLPWRLLAGLTTLEECGTIALPLDDPDDRVFQRIVRLQLCLHALRGGV